MDVFHVRGQSAAAFRLCDVDDAGDIAPRYQCGIISSFAVAEIKVIGDSA